MLVLGLVVATGCSSAEPTTPAEEPAAPTQEITGTKWNALEMGVSGKNIDVMSSAPITAEFGEDGTLSGSSGVNTYTTKYTVEGNKIEIAPEIATTMMAGPEDAMAQETNYLTTLPTAVSFSFTEDGKLVLLGPAGNMVVRYTPITE